MIKSRPRILIVDDEPMVLELVQTVLREAGYDAVVRGTARDAILAIQQEAPFDVLIADLRLPGIDAIGMHRQLVQARHTLAERMVVMTGDVGNVSIERFVRETGNLLLRKPFLLDALRQAVSTTLRRASHPLARVQG